MINEGVKVPQENERKELVDTQNKFLEYREKLKENERVEER